jgi:16S rRNA (guanine1207-N2)-methyltransferase
MNEQVGNPRARLIKTEAQGSGYFDWLIHTVALKGRQVRVYTKPGVPGFRTLDPAAGLLAENLDVQPREAVLALNCGPGLVGTVAAQLAEGSPVTLVNPNCVAAEAARRTLAANGVEGVPVFAQDCLDAIVAGSVDRIALRLPKGKPRLKQFLWEGFRALRTGGKIYLAGGNQEGIKTALKMTGDLFGQVSVLAYRQGHRVGCAVKERAVPEVSEAFAESWLAPEAFLSFSVQVRGFDVEVRSRPGVFSWDRLDQGTARLLEVLKIAPGDTVLDLGCGYGLIGVVAALLAQDTTVTLVDSDAAAVRAAEATLAANQVESGRVLLQDCGTGLAPGAFDVVATNPPFHQGKGTDYDVGEKFIQQAAKLLKPGGVLYLVANRFLPYEGPIARAFGNSQQLTLGSRYKVLLGRK